jgi:hypothetical protein
VVGGKHRLSFGPDEYVFAALNLYLGMFDADDLLVNVSFMDHHTIILQILSKFSCKFFPY